MQSTRRALSTVLLLSTLLAGLWAYAAGPGPLERLLPYQGRLERGGQPLTGTVDLTFALFDDADEQASQLSWTETHASVPVRQGVFSVELGAIEALPDEVFASSELFLSISVEGIRLAGLQRIYPMPAALRADAAEDMTVSGDLTVGGGVEVASDLNVVGDLNLTGQANGLTVTRGTCTTVTDNWELAGGTENGPLRYLDRMNNLTCPANTVLVDWNTSARTNPAAEYQVSFVCCSLVVQ